MWFVTALRAECDMGACKQAETVENSDQVSMSILSNILVSKGWYLPFGGGKTLCPTCAKMAALKYKTKLIRDGSLPPVPKKEPVEI